MRKLKKNYSRNVTGSILPIAALLIAAIIPLCGIAVDMGYYGILRGTLEKGTEAASVAGAQEFFRSRANAGRAVNETVRVFKMNITNDTMVGNYYSSTGQGNPSTLTYSRIFTDSDGIGPLFKGSPITITVVTNINRGSITVTTEMIPRPFFAQLFSSPSPIRITKVANLPPYDLAFVFDLSGSMRFATIMTYIGRASVEQVGMPGTAMLLNDVILYQSQSQNWGRGSMITANGLVTTIDAITDVLINSPNVDSHIFGTYDNGMRMYIFDPDRDYITNTQNSQGLRRTALSGLRLDPARLFSLPDEARSLYDTFQKNRSMAQAEYGNYFDRAAGYIEPHSSAVYGVMSFINTVRMYGAAGLNLALVTFASNSFTNDTTLNWGASELLANGQSKTVRDVYPYVMLIEPSRFSDITSALTVMLGNITGNGNTINVNSYSNGGTNISAGLNNALWTFQRSTRPQAQKVVILFTDGAPGFPDSFGSVGNTVRRLTDQGITVYSVVLTLAVGPGVVTQFRNAVENVGRGQPVIFIDNPAQLNNAFMQIADDLGLKLVS